MSPNPIKSNSIKESEEEVLRDPFSAESPKSAPVEVTETISDKEREKMRGEVLEAITETESPVKKAPAPAPAPQPVLPAPVKSERLVIIEDILAEDLQDVYFKMDPAVRQKFKEEGEKTASKIEQLMTETKDQTQKIFKLIFSWLKLIPGVKKYFLNQEAKLKADKIMRIKR